MAAIDVKIIQFKQRDRTDEDLKKVWIAPTLVSAANRLVSGTNGIKWKRQFGPDETPILYTVILMVETSHSNSI